MTAPRPSRTESSGTGALALSCCSPVEGRSAVTIRLHAVTPARRRGSGIGWRENRPKAPTSHTSHPMRAAQLLPLLLLRAASATERRPVLPARARQPRSPSSASSRSLVADVSSESGSPPWAPPGMPPPRRTAVERLATLAGWAVSIGALALYLPILIRLLRTRKSGGLVLSTWVSNTLGYTVLLIYPLSRRYPLSSYLEYAVLLVQARASTSCGAHRLRPTPPPAHAGAHCTRVPARHRPRRPLISPRGGTRAAAGRVLLRRADARRTCRAPPAVVHRCRAGRRLRHHGRWPAASDTA